MDSEKKVLSVVDGNRKWPPPVWLMRQAGRHLPEYREIRASVGSFLDLCYTPRLAAEVTLQPVRRYNLDAAILFSDILVIPDSLGCGVKFSESRGPTLTPVDCDRIAALNVGGISEHLMPVFEAIRLARRDLGDDKTLIGFCGAPWTVATYMVAGQGTADHLPARKFAHAHRKSFNRLLSLLADVSADYLIRQFDAGADVLQIFESWADVLGEEDFDQFSIAPIARMIYLVKSQRPQARIIVFIRGAGVKLRDVRDRTGADCLGVDWTQPLSFIAELQKQGPVQGNLDPLRLLVGGSALRDAAQHLLEGLENGPFIFNLGHGIHPETSPDHVTELIHIIRASGPYPVAHPTCLK